MSYDDYLVTSCELIMEGGGTTTSYIPTKFAQTGLTILINKVKYTVGRIYSYPTSKDYIKQMNKQDLHGCGKSNSRLDIRNNWECEDSCF